MTLTLGKLINEYRHTDQAHRALALIPVPIIRRDERLNTKQKAVRRIIISFACAQALFDAHLTNTYIYVHLRISREVPSKCPPARVMERRPH